MGGGNKWCSFHVGLLYFINLEKSKAWRTRKIIHNTLSDGVCIQWWVSESWKTVASIWSLIYLVQPSPMGSPKLAWHSTVVLDSSSYYSAIFTGQESCPTFSLVYTTQSWRKGSCSLSWNMVGININYVSFQCVHNITSDLQKGKWKPGFPRYAVSEAGKSEVLLPISPTPRYMLKYILLQF